MIDRSKYFTIIHGNSLLFVGLSCSLDRTLVARQFTTSTDRNARDLHSTVHQHIDSSADRHIDTHSDREIDRSYNFACPTYGSSSNIILPWINVYLGINRPLSTENVGGMMLDVVPGFIHILPLLIMIIRTIVRETMDRRRQGSRIRSPSRTDRSFIPL